MKDGATSELQNVCVTGSNVILRPRHPRYAATAFELLHANQSILRWLVWQGPESADELAGIYAHWSVGEGYDRDYGFTILERPPQPVPLTEERVVGSITLRFRGQGGNGDVGYWLGEPYWGRGYMTEAVGLLAHLAFAHLRAFSLCAWVFEGNTASRRVLEHNGFQLSRTTGARPRSSGYSDRDWYLVRLVSEWHRDPERVRPTSEEISWF